MPTNSFQTQGELKSLLKAGESLLVPGAFDAMSAKMIEACGFKAVYLSGFGVSASYLGLPDVGLMTFSEMGEVARRVIGAVKVPVIVDADTGYGNALNTIRTVRELERIGAAAIQLEDQVFPKKCGHIQGKKVISQEEMCAKLKAALDSRHSEEFLIIARTDARATHGLEAAIERAMAYKELGVDGLFIEALETEAEIEAVSKAFRGFPLVFNWAQGGKTPHLPLGTIQKLGFQLVIFPVSPLLASAWAMKRMLKAIQEAGTPLGMEEASMPFRDFLSFIGLDRVYDLEERYKA